jgi:hypothetical protein
MLGQKTFLEKIGVKKQVEPKELVRKWQSEIRTEQRRIERQVLGAETVVVPLEH